MNKSQNSADLAKEQHGKITGLQPCCGTCLQPLHNTSSNALTGGSEAAFACSAFRHCGFYSCCQKLVWVCTLSGAVPCHACCAVSCCAHQCLHCSQVITQFCLMVVHQQGVWYHNQGLLGSESFKNTAGSCPTTSQHMVQHSCRQEDRKLNKKYNSCLTSYSRFQRHAGTSERPCKCSRAAVAFQHELRLQDQCAAWPELKQTWQEEY